MMITHLSPAKAIHVVLFLTTAATAVVGSTTRNIVHKNKVVSSSSSSVDDSSLQHRSLLGLNEMFCKESLDTNDGSIVCRFRIMPPTTDTSSSSTNTPKTLIQDCLMGADPFCITAEVYPYDHQANHQQATGVVVDVDDDADNNSMSVVNNGYGDDLIQIVSGDNPELDDDYKFALTATENEDGNDENDDVIQIVSGDNPEADEVEVSYVDATKNNGYGDDLIQIVSGDNPELDDDYKFALAYGDVIGDENNSCQTIPELLCGEGSVEKFTTVCDLWKEAFPDSKDKKTTTTMTLFAPTDQAFQLMEDLFSKGENNYSLTNEEYLEVFQFHVVPGRTVLFENLLCDELLEMSSKTFFSRTKCNIDTDGTTSTKIQRGGGNRKNNIEPRITTSDIRACHDSVIHIINEVMLPNFIDQLI